MKKTLVLLLMILCLAWSWAVADNILSEDFESEWDLNTPPTGWTILDFGSEGQQCWYTQDWHKRFYSYWDDTVAYINYSPRMESDYDDWMITPEISIPGGASACSLTFETFYDDGNSTALGDSAFIKISADGGAHWSTLETWGADIGSMYTPFNANIDCSSYSGQSVKFAFNLKTHGTTTYNAIRTWVIDDVAVWADASSLYSFDFNGWGPWGDNPPAGWTIYDYGTPMPAAGVPNNNDWHKYPVWESFAARVYYEIAWYSEWQKEWLISPTFAIGTDYACTLSFAQYYNHVPSIPWDADHGFIMVSTDAGHSWPYTLQDLTETTGDQGTKTYFKYDLGAFAGESNVQVAFNFTNNASSIDWWAIDDVSIDQFAPITQDPGVISVDAPADVVYTGGNYTITANIGNLLSDSTIIDSVLFQVDSDEFPEVVFSNTIYPGIYLQGYENRQFSSSAQWSPYPDDHYMITVTVFGSGDENPLNNSLVVDRYAQSVVSFPFTEDFETPIIDNIWDWVGLGEGFGTTSNAHSPVTALWFDDDAVYPAERLAVSPPIYISGSVDPELKFWERSADANGPQGQEIHTVGLMPGEWDFHNFIVLFQEDTSSTTLQDSLWRESTVDAGDIEGDTVRVVIWYHCGDFPDRSWYVDDVSLSERVPMGTVSGQVTDANTTDPIVGAIVTASSDQEDIIVDTTDFTGNYSIDITAGPTTVTVELAGYLPDTNQVIVYDGQTTVHDVALTPEPVGRCCYPEEDVLCTDNTQSECFALNGNWDSGLNCRDNPCPIIGTVAGLVTDANTADPIVGAIVTASSDVEDIIVDTTDFTGNYSIDITPGPTTVTVELSGYFPDTNQVIVYEGQTTINDVALVPEPVGRCCYPEEDVLCTDNTESECFALNGNWDSGLNCHDNPCPIIGTVAGLVTDANTADPIVGAIVTASSDEEDVIVDTTDFTGNYSIDITPGPMTVTVELSGYIPDTNQVIVYEGQTTIHDVALVPEPVGRCCYPEEDVLCTDNTQSECFALNGNWDPGLNCRDNPCPVIGTVAGLVTDANNADPIVGAIVTASSDEEDVIVDTTDFTGNYSIDITPGPMTVTVELSGYIPDTNQVIVYEGQTTIHDVVLTSPMADIDTSPVEDTVAVGDTALYSRFLYNIGSAPLDYDVTLSDPEGGPVVFNVNVDPEIVNVANSADSKPENQISSLSSDKGPLPVILDVSWISVTSGQAGSVVPGDSAEIVFMVDFRDTTIIPGYLYSADANINSNDPYSYLVIPFSITAESGGCDYVVGDVNGSSSYNGLDITYGVAFFKGGNDPLCVDCPLCPGYWYCGDVNGTCNYNGLDITYGVAYLKGGAGLIPCADCPPIE